MHRAANSHAALIRSSIACREGPRLSVLDVGPARLRWTRRDRSAGMVRRPPGSGRSPILINSTGPPPAVPPPLEDR